MGSCLWLSPETRSRSGDGTTTSAILTLPWDGKHRRNLLEKPGYEPPVSDIRLVLFWVEPHPTISLALRLDTAAQPCPVGDAWSHWCQLASISSLRTYRSCHSIGSQSAYCTTVAELKRRRENSGYRSYRLSEIGWRSRRPEAKRIGIRGADLAGLRRRTPALQDRPDSMDTR